MPHTYSRGFPLYHAPPPHHAPPYNHVRLITNMHWINNLQMATFFPPVFMYICAEYVHISK